MTCMQSLGDLDVHHYIFEADDPSEMCGFVWRPSASCCLVSCHLIEALKIGPRANKDSRSVFFGDGRLSEGVL